MGRVLMVTAVNPLIEKNFPITTRNVGPIVAVVNEKLKIDKNKDALPALHLPFL